MHWFVGWWFVSAEDGQGWAPSSYLERPDGQVEDTSTPVDNPGLCHLRSTGDRRDYKFTSVFPIY